MNHNTRLKVFLAMGIAMGSTGIVGTAQTKDLNAEKNVAQQQDTHQKDNKVESGDWSSKEGDTSGFVYCSVSIGSTEEHYAWKERSQQLWKYDVGVGEWKKIEWRRGIPVPTGLLIPIVRCGTEDIGSPQYEGLSGEEYIERACEVLATGDAYYEFEKLFLHPAWYGITTAMENAIRLHGKKVCGITQLESSMYSTYGISLQTELESKQNSISTRKLTRYSMRSLASETKALSEHLDFYPREFVQNSGLHTVILVKNIRRKYVEQTRRTYRERWLASGGVGWDDGVIIITSISDHFHHEFHHQADREDGGLKNENARWGKQAHGAQYASLYGKNGWDAIVNGQTKGKRPIGFYDLYARKGGIDEDQARTAEAMLKSPQSCRELLALAKNEPSLLRKIQMTMAFYERRSDGLMDDQFWADYLQGEMISSAYWQKRRQMRGTTEADVTTIRSSRFQ